MNKVVLLKFKNDFINTLSFLVAQKECFYIHKY